MMATVPHVTFGLGLRKFQADGFLLTRVYNALHSKCSKGHNQIEYTLHFYSYSITGPYHNKCSKGQQ